jgi:crossover junction endodeoxyribonuclease RuvC
MGLILGIDPGSLRTGFGVINATGGRLEYVTSGVIRLPSGELPERLGIIFEDLCEVIETHKPEAVSVEQVFMSRNAGSALKLGHARGAAVVAAVHHGVPVAEYSARQIKQSVVGTGAADKAQVQHMVRVLLKLSGTPQEDAADALAAALCHAHTRQAMIKMAGSGQLQGRMRGGRVR